MPQAERMRKEFARIGRELSRAGLVTARGGNLSMRAGDRLLITRHGAMLGHLTAGDLIETGLEGDDSGGFLPSSDVAVHRAVYRKTSARAVVHAHPVTAILLSLDAEVIVPADTEGSILLNKVSVVGAAASASSPETAETVSDSLRDHGVAMLRGHGSFAAGRTLEDAFSLTTTLEASCRILYMARVLGRNFGP